MVSYYTEPHAALPEGGPVHYFNPSWVCQKHKKANSSSKNAQFT
jgi:hypothetical protein